MPFLADELWQNLVRGACPDAPPSVHLSSYPAEHPMLADEVLLAEMETVRVGGRAGPDRPRASRGEAPPAACSR